MSTLRRDRRHRVSTRRSAPRDKAGKAGFDLRFRDQAGTVQPGTSAPFLLVHGC